LLFTRAKRDEALEVNISYGRSKSLDLLDDLTVTITKGREDLPVRGRAGRLELS
jgi:hypothetical protein